MKTNGPIGRGGRSQRKPDRWRGILYALLISAAILPVTAAVGEISQDHTRLLLEEGYSLFDAGRLSEAERRFLDVLAADPDSLPANEGLMWIYHDSGDTAKAVRYADALLALAPDDMEVLKKWLVVAITDSDKEPAVLAAARQLAGSYRDDVNGLAYLAGLLSSSDSYLASATILYRQIITLDPKETGPRLKLAHLLYRTGQFDEAADEYRRVLEIAPGNVTAKQGIAELALQTGDHMGAIQLFEQQLAEDPDNVGALIGLARQAKFDGDLVTALEFLERADSMHPDNPDIRTELDEIRNDAERLKRARYGPTLPIVFTVTVLPLLYGSFVRRVSARSYYLLAVCAAAVSVAALCWLFLVPLN